MRGAGAVHGTLKRFSLCARTCEPRPSTKRPREADWRSQLAFATAIGLRENAIAMLVWSDACSVLTAATARARNGSFLFSDVVRPLKPAVSAARATPGTARRSSWGTWTIRSEEHTSELQSPSFISYA